MGKPSRDIELLDFTGHESKTLVSQVIEVAATALEGGNYQ